MKFTKILVTASLFIVNGFVAQSTDQSINLEKYLDSVYGKTVPANLDLSGIRIGEIGFGYYGNVEKLNLSYSNFSPYNLERLSQIFPNIESLNLSNNQLLALDNSIGKFSKLIELDLSANDFISVPFSLYYTPNLKSLNLSNNHIEFSEEVVGNLWSLEVLNVQNNPDIHLTKIIENLQFHDQMRSLYASGSKSGRINFSNALKQTTIENFNIDNATGDFVRNFTDNQNVRAINFSNYEASEATDPLFERIPNLKSISFTQSTIPSNIEKLKSLSTLTINGDFQIGELSKSRQIDTLKISNSDLKKSDIVVLQNQLKNTVIVSDVSMFSDEMASNSVVPIIKELESEKVTFEANEPKVISFEDVSFDIPANAFLTKSGEVYSGTVDFKVTPIMDPVSMALIGAPMMADISNEKGLFSSSGMFEVEAKTSTGEELKPNPENTIQVNLENQINSSKPDLFQYSEENKNWMPIEGFNMDKEEERVKMLDSLKSTFVQNPFFTRLRRNYAYVGEYKKKRYDASILNLSTYEKPEKETFAKRQESGAYATKMSWLIDTIVSKELDSILKTHFDRPRNNRFKKSKMFPVYDIQLKRSMNEDNYRLIYRFGKDTINIPIMPYVSVAPDNFRRHQEKIAKFEKNRRKLEIKDSIYNRVYAQKIDSVNRYLTEMSKRTIAPYNPEQNNDRLSFGLTRFGLINCDFFSRNIPQSYVAMGEQIEDQDGNKVEVPEVVRVVLPDMNTYTEMGRESIPKFDKARTIGIIIISAFELGIFNLDGKNKVEKVKRINIQGKSSKEIGEIILD
ncbi:MAG: leucine-rich repeat domain-containing protein [Fluviicola sp.]